MGTDDDWAAVFAAACARLEQEPKSPDWLKQILRAAQQDAALLAPEALPEESPPDFVYPH
jgi:hypothetical protein